MLEHDRTNPLSRSWLLKINSLKKLRIVMTVMNTLILPNYIADALTLEYLHTLVGTDSIV